MVRSALVLLGRAQGSACTSGKWVHRKVGACCLPHLQQGAPTGQLWFCRVVLSLWTEDCACIHCHLLTTSLGPGTHVFVPQGFPLLLPWWQDRVPGI